MITKNLFLKMTKFFFIQINYPVFKKFDKNLNRFYDEIIVILKK